MTIESLHFRLAELRQWLSPFRSIDALCGRAERLCKLLAPELSDAPLYVVPQSQLRDYFQTDATAGWTQEDLDLVLMDELGHKFKGRGPAMVINDTGRMKLAVEEAEELNKRWWLANQPRDPFYVHPEPLFITRFLSTVIHELGHILDRENYAGGVPIEPGDRTAVAFFQKLYFSTGPQLADVVYEAPKDRCHHEAPFIRLVLHLAFRARRRGFSLEVNDLCAGGFYGQSPATDYDRALGDEPLRMVNATFATIRATPPPATFQKLWLADQVAYHEKQARAIRDESTEQTPAAG